LTLKMYPIYIFTSVIGQPPSAAIIFAGTGCPEE
jgi:hypothetical protein